MGTKKGSLRSPAESYYPDEPGFRFNGILLILPKNSMVYPRL